MSERAREKLRSCLVFLAVATMLKLGLTLVDFRQKVDFCQKSWLLLTLAKKSGLLLTFAKKSWLLLTFAKKVDFYWNGMTNSKFIA